MARCVAGSAPPQTEDPTRTPPIGPDPPRGEGAAHHSEGVDASLSIPLRRRGDLAADGVDRHRLDALLRSGLFRRIRPGVYAETADTTGLSLEGWIVVRARALALVSAEPPLFSHLTAAALHGWPTIAADSERVHVILDERRRGAVASAVRHRGEVPADDIVERHGLRCTSIPRTMADVARTCAFDTAVCVLDAALRGVAHTRVAPYDAERAEEMRARALTIALRSAHGRSRAYRALAFADGKAQLPGESISRIRLAQLGFEPPRLQVPVAGPSGTNYYVDFGLDDVQAWGEFDGTGKYLDDALRSGRTTDEVVLREKQREDWIRGVTRRPVVRWGWSHLRTADTLGRRLAAFHLTPRTS